MRKNQLLSFYLFALLFIPSMLFANAGLQTIHFTPAELIKIQGHYSTVYGYVFIQVRGRYVSTNIDGKHIQLVKKSDGHFYPKYKLLRFIPINLGDMSFSLKQSNGKQQILMHEKKKKTQTVAQKFKPSEIPSLWKQRLGKYKAKLLKGRSKIKHIRLAVKRGVLVAYINKITNPYPLLALSGSRIYSPSAGHNRSQPITILTDKQDLKLIYNRNNLLLKKL